MSTANVVSVGGPSWFDAFRDNGGPVLYSSMNRTPAIEDIRNILIYISFSTLFVAFLIIFPGIRKERFSTFICVTISLFMGSVILLSNCGTNWHIARGSIASPYRAFSREKIFADVGVHIGLDSVNITLKALPIHQRYKDINYNERFYWIGPSQMKQEFQRALAKGLPYPILTISEYLSQDGEGFNWGRNYRLAGYYTSITLWVAFASWILMNILLCAVPRYGAYTMQLTGALLLLADLLYVALIPAKPLRIPFEGATLTFTYGWCFWMVFSAGITGLVIGATVSIVDIMFPNKFSTILEVDYDTPYRYFVGNDAHIIGSLPPPLATYYYHHQHEQSSLNSSNHHLYQKKKSSNCKHYSASKTASIATDSTCCAGSTTQLTHRPAIKTKSDASTCTRDEIDLDNLSNEKQQFPSPLNKQTFVTTVEIEHNNNVVMAQYPISEFESKRHNNPVIEELDESSAHLEMDSLSKGFENQAYLVDGGDESSAGVNGSKVSHDPNLMSNNSTGETTVKNDTRQKQSAKQQSPSNGAIAATSLNDKSASPLPSSGSSFSSGSSADEEDEDIESDVSTTIIDGKRAISLSNFGKYAEQQQKRVGAIPHRSMLINGPTFGHPMASSGFRANKNNSVTGAALHSKRTQAARDKMMMSKSTESASSSVTAQSSSHPYHRQSSPTTINNQGGVRSKTSSSSSSLNTGVSGNNPMTTMANSSVKVDLSSAAAMW